MLKIAIRILEIYLLMFFILITGYRQQLQDTDLVIISIIILAAVMAAWLIYLIFSSARLAWPDLKGLLAAFILAVVSSVINAAYPVIALNELMIWIATAAVAYLVYNLINYGYKASWIYTSLMVVGGIYTLLKYLQIAQQLPERTTTCSKYMSSQNMTAAMIVMVMILALSQLLASMKIWPGLLLAAATGVLILSGSRGGLLSAAVALPAVYIYHDIKSDREIGLKKIRWLKYGLIIAACAAVAVAIILALRPIECVPLNAPPSEAEATAAHKNGAWESSIITRFDMWKAALDIYKQRPLFGAGLANYQLMIGPIVNDRITPPHAHNLYLSILAERGAAGLITTLALLLYISWQMWKHTANVTHAAAAQAAIIALLIHGLPDVPTKELFVSRYLLLILVIGLASVKTLDMEEKKDEPVI